MSAEDIKQLIDYLRSLADPQVQNLLQIAWKQVIYNRVWDMAWIVASAIFYSKFIPWTRENWEEINGDYGPGGPCWRAIIGFCLAIILFVVVLANVDSILNTIINPEWMLYKRLISIVK